MHIEFFLVYCLVCKTLSYRHWSVACADVNEAIVTAAEAMEGAAGCASGGEKCLYTVCTTAARNRTMEMHDN